MKNLVIKLVNNYRYIITAALFLLIGVLISNFNNAMVIDNLKETIVSLENHENVMAQKLRQMTDDYNDSIQTIKEMNSKYTALYDEYMEYQDTVGFSQEKLYDIANKYMYVIEKAPKRSELTLENLIYMDELAEKYDINPHIVTSLFETESSYDSTAKNKDSTATGLGQFLAATGKYVYYDLLGYDGDYYHPVSARIPQLNIEMTLKYLDYLVDYRGDIKSALKYYSGGSSNYVTTVMNRAKIKMGSSVVPYNYIP